MINKFIKYILIILVLTGGGIQAFGQYHSFEVRTTKVGDYRLAVEMRDLNANPPATDSLLLDIVFGIKWDETADADLDDVISTTYNIKKSDLEQSKNGFQYQAFYADNIPFNFPVNWVTDQWTEIASMDVTILGSGEFVFEICELGFHFTTDANINVDPIDYTPIINGSAPLYFQLEEFTARIYEKNSAILNWRAIVDQDASHFEIERSTDAFNWRTITKVKVDNRYIGEEDFEYVDQDVYSPEGAYNVFRYRLKMVEEDGTFDYSYVRQVRFEESINNVTIQVYPNPATDILFFSIPYSKSEDEIEIQIVNGSGRLEINKNLTNNVGGQHNIDVNSLSQGLYHVKVVASGKEHYFPIVILK